MNRNRIAIIISIIFLAVCISFSFYLKSSFSVISYIIISLILFVLCTLIIYLTKDIRKNLFLFLLIAVLARAAFIAHEPPISKDIYRYLWEGKIQTYGYNPFAIAPADERLKGLRDKYWKKLEYKKIPSIYPPFSQFVFYISAIISKVTGNQLLVLKLIFFLFDMAILFMIYLFVKNRYGVKWTLLYAFHPISILEISLNGHVDVLMTFFLVLALYFKFEDMAGYSIICMFFGILSKIYIITTLPLFLKKDRKVFACFWLGVLILFSAYLPYLSKDMFKGLYIFTRLWAFNSPFYSFISSLANPDLSRILSLLLYLILYSIYFIKFKKFKITLRIFFNVFTFYILSPILHPWYLLLMLPILSFHSIYGVYLLTGTIFISYEIYILWLKQNIWQQKTYILLIVWLPMIAFTIYDFVRFMRKYKANKLKTT